MTSQKDSTSRNSGNNLRSIKSMNSRPDQTKTYTLMDTGRMVIEEKRSILKSPQISISKGNQIAEKTNSALSMVNS